MVLMRALRLDIQGPFFRIVVRLSAYVSFFCQFIDECNWKPWRRCGLFQATRHIHNIYSDYLIVYRNTVSQVGIFMGRDGFVLTPFVGTNISQRFDVLDDIGSFVYSSFVNDPWPWVKNITLNSSGNMHMATWLRMRYPHLWLRQCWLKNDEENVQ